MDIFGVIAGPLGIFILVAGETGKIQGHEVLGKGAIIGEHTGVGVCVYSEEMGFNIPHIRAQGLR